MQRKTHYLKQTQLGQTQFFIHLNPSHGLFQNVFSYFFIQTNVNFFF